MRESCKIKDAVTSQRMKNKKVRGTVFIFYVTKKNGSSPQQEKSFLKANDLAKSNSLNEEYGTRRGVPLMNK